MADDTAPHGAPEAPEVPTPEVPADTDWKAEARKWESRAKENLAAAKANEDAAKRLAELEDAQKTEAQKAQERLKAAEERAAELELKANRAEVAAEKGIPAELLSGSTREELEASADALIAFKGDQSSRLIVRGEGKTPAPKPLTPAEQFAQSFEGKI